MTLFPIEQIKCESDKTLEIKHIVESTLRLIAYSREHLADDLLNAYISKITSFKELLSIKNAQMEAQNEDEAKRYTKHLNLAIDFITNEIEQSVNLKTEVQLFQLFRIISPDSHSVHPNHYRDRLVQIGRYLCPEPNNVPSLVSDLFYWMKGIQNPIIKSIYFHHELIRIHPFVDGNGRTTRMAKNWMLMYELYSPIFISTEKEKKEYIQTLEQSFLTLEKYPDLWNKHMAKFFDQELNRLMQNTKSVYEYVRNAGNQRK